MLLHLHDLKTESSSEQKLCVSSNPFLDQESFHKIDTIPKASVLATKLIIGNIEANPGPVDLKEFLAFLFVDAEDTSVKEVLKEVKASQDRHTNLKKIRSKTVDELKATLAYLNDWNNDDEGIKNEIDSYTKEGIAYMLIKKIYNMAPARCTTCQKTSHFKPGEFCVITCIRCNRGACVPCYESEKEKLKSIVMFNKSIYYSCETCTEIITKENHVEEAYKKKASGKKKSQIEENPPQTKSPDSMAGLAEAIGGLSVDDIHEHETITLEESESENLSSPSIPQEPGNISSPRIDPESKKEKSSIPQEPKTCIFLKQNRCEFGISGKGCKFSHPKMCQKLLSHGKSSYRGCTKEEEKAMEGRR